MALQFYSLLSESKRFTRRLEKKEAGVPRLFLFKRLPNPKIFKLAWRIKVKATVECRGNSLALQIPKTMASPIKVRDENKKRAFYTSVFSKRKFPASISSLRQMGPVKNSDVPVASPLWTCAVDLNKPDPIIFATSGMVTLKNFLNTIGLSAFSILRGGYLSIFFLLLLPLATKADEKNWIFLPASPLFQPLIGDPRERFTSIIAYANENRYEGSVGATAEFFRYLPPDQTKWAFGIFGSGIILLDEAGDVFPMRAADWYAGLYFSGSIGPFANRLEFEHQSAHLGDSLQGIQTPIIYNGENFNFTGSFEPWEDVRIAAQIGRWVSGLPEEKYFFEALEGEIYSPALDLAGTFVRGYATVHLKWKDEAGGVLDKSVQVGVQWKFKKTETRDLRFAFVYYIGNSQFGQFYLNRDEHAGIGVYFDP